ncbi:MAG: hypothetical protein JO349_02220 [Candidatus Eremiobacteraeota bacterium]|nr:hypothetical protein [Candidatus Eremiobacteraeota bacterium]MBV8722121.1 hypothetical protein [Candidatus Eremiobacteraeota bacterium]
MAVPERQLDMPTLRALQRAGGFLSTEDLRPILQSQFTEPIGQLNVISNMDGGNSLISRGLVSRQVRYDDDDWYDFNDHLPKEGRRPEQRLALTEKGRILLAVVPDREAMVPDNFEEILTPHVTVLRERAEAVGELVPQRDEADRDIAPTESTIPVEPPRPPKAGEHAHDPEARRQANARRVVRHHALVVALTTRAVEAGLEVVQTKYADALIRTGPFGAIFEMKTVKENSRTDLIHQLRAAIAQLYHYRFIHRRSPGFEHNAKLYAVFDATVPEDLLEFLREINIGAIWRTDEQFHGDDETTKELPWLSDQPEA